MDRANIEKIAKTPEDKVLLAKLWDKINSGITRNIPVNTRFLSPRELELARFLFGNIPGLITFGGYDGSERQMIYYLPDYMDAQSLYDEEGPMACLRATFYQGDTPSHRDFLGALIGSGISRDAIGDICVGKGSCDFFTSSEITPWLLQNFISAGRTKLHLEQIPFSMVQIPEPEIKAIRDTLASLRLDNVISSGFRVSRSIAAQYITTGRVSIDGLPCEKPDKMVDEGIKVSVRGLGKIKLKTVSGQTKKGRISVVIDRYM